MYHANAAVRTQNKRRRTRTCKCSPAIETGRRPWQARQEQDQKMAAQLNRDSGFVSMKIPMSTSSPSMEAALTTI